TVEGSRSDADTDHWTDDLDRPLETSEDEALTWTGCNCVGCQIRRIQRNEAPPASANPKQQYGDAKLPVHWVPPAAICAMAQGLGEGGRKYGPYNWRDAPVETMTYYAGAVRHLMA